MTPSSLVIDASEESSDRCHLTMHFKETLTPSSLFTHESEETLLRGHLAMHFKEL